MSKAFTVDELQKYNGSNNKPAYVGYKGKVYDVSKVFQAGEHAGIKAGTDLTNIFSKSPHAEDIFINLPVVGELVISTNPITKLFQVSTQQADIILRVALGTVFFAHGAQKLFGWFGGYGWTGTIGFFNQALGIPAFFTGLAILAEFFGGIAIILGLLTRPAALGLAITMLFAAVKVSLANGFFLDLKGSADGVEYVFVLFMISLYFVFKGAGSISVDKVIAAKLAGETK